MIVGSTSTITDDELFKRLSDSGSIIFSDYIENIAEIYQCADFYIFPTTDEYNCIEMPLSVLEAMACNLPVISTKFGALTDFFSEGDGFYFFKSSNTIFDEVITLINKEPDEVKTREKVKQFFWNEIVKQIEHLYTKLLTNQLNDYGITDCQISKKL